MARKLTEINEELRLNFMQNSTLQQFYGLQPTDTFDAKFSLVSFERALLFVFAFSIWTIEKLQDQHITLVEKRAAELEYGNLAWYKRKALEFQFGDALEFDGKEFSYPIKDEEKQVIKLASASEVNNMVLIKCAKIGSSEEIVPLTNAELTAASVYMQKRKYAGVRLAVISRPADLFRCAYRVYYDPLVMNADGTLISDPSRRPVDEAIEQYCKFMNDSFDANFVITELTDSIQRAVGVLNPIFVNAFARFGTNAYKPITEYYRPNAGYLTIDPAFPLDTSITYLLP
jgi:hypothetical protein